MKMLKSIMITLSVIALLMGIQTNPCLAASCYLPLISFDPTPPPPMITPVTPEFAVGSWAMTTVVTGVTDFYLHVGSDGSLAINDYPNDNPHIFGSWSISGGTFVGPFENPNVGTGDLVGTIVNGVFTLDFIEYWHSPPKHILYTATKL